MQTHYFVNLTVPIAVTRKLLAENPRLKILALSHYLDRDVVMQMLDAGASGYLAKSADISQLLRAIRSVSQGHNYVSSEIASMLVDSKRGKMTIPKPRSEQLSPLELEILSLLTDGRTCLQIAARLSVATSTVESHLRNIMLKLDLH